MRREKLAIGGALGAAVGASICCVGPLVAAVLGLGAFGASSFFGPARPYLLAGAVLLLAFGFYATYWRRAPDCAPGEACAPTKAHRTGTFLLWFASVLVVAFALMPYYIGFVGSALTRKTAPAALAPAADQAGQFETLTVRVEGMDCASCEIPIRAALEKTAGVQGADVSYQRGDARVTFDPRQTDAQQIKRAIDSTGYHTR
ncbi:MAG: cation transporter [Acidobacteriaceae bacterium]|nr:cation transporter [Acidobacteriaceae bacterium]